MKQFAKDLLMGIALVSIGLGVLAYADAIETPNELDRWEILQAGLIGGGSMVIGNGVTFPLNKPWLGFVIGCLVLLPALWVIMH